jgi:protein-L-isoaspartate(D-aspartate) O-methyltransferase
MTRVLATTLVLVALATVALAAEDFATERRLMVEEIERLAASTAAETKRATLDPRVLEAMAKVPRHEFVPPEEASAAYQNRPVPIGHGQTISQPFIVALMTDLLRPSPTDTVLEVGTGSGYQAAVLSLLVREVYTIEIVEELGKEAAQRLTRLGYENVKGKVGDGYLGWPEHAPFDAIMVTAAPDHIPPALLDELKPNGRMVIPVGELTQDLMLVVKNPDGTGTSTTIAPVRFVPLIRRGEKTD